MTQTPLSFDNFSKPQQKYAFSRWCISALCWLIVLGAIFGCALIFYESEWNKLWMIWAVLGLVAPIVAASVIYGTTNVILDCADQLNELRCREDWPDRWRDEQ